MHSWRGPLVDVLVVLCEAVCCGAGGVGVSRVRACVWLCAGIDYKQRSLEINGKQLRLSIWYVLVCSCLCMQRVGEWVVGYGDVSASVCKLCLCKLHFWNLIKSFTVFVVQKTPLNG